MKEARIRKRNLSDVNIDFYFWNCECGTYELRIIAMYVCKSGKYVRNQARSALPL